jgi:hypothetical protein
MPQIPPEQIALQHCAELLQPPASGMHPADGDTMARTAAAAFESFPPPADCVLVSGAPAASSTAVEKSKSIALNSVLMDAFEMKSSLS